MIGFRDAVTVLQPVRDKDPYSGELGPPDRTQPPKATYPVRGAVQPLSSTEAVLTASTVVSRWRCWVPPDTPLDPLWRIRWRDNDYEIDDAVGLHTLGPTKHHLPVVLKLVEG